MATVVITPEMQRANAEVLLGSDPRRGNKIKDAGERWTATRRKEIERLLKQTEADRPVTILNLNPIPLKINGGVYFYDEIPACPVGQPYAIYTIDKTRWGHRDLGCDSQNMMQMEPVPAIPLVLAAEYIREYVQQDGGFGGVLCYVGTDDPTKFKKGHQVRVPEVAYNDMGEFYVDLKDRDFYEMLAIVREKRNATIMRRLQVATNWHENESQRMNVGDRERDMARMALHEGLIEKLPDWVLHRATLSENRPDPCPACAVIPKTGAILCVNCGQIFDVLAAYKNGRIAYNAVEMDRLDAEGWKAANQIKAERDKAKGIKA